MCSFILKDGARAKHFLPDVVLISPRVHCKFLRVKVKKAIAVPKRKHRKLQCFCAPACNMTQQKGHELERKLWETLLVCVCEHVLTK